MLSGLWMRADQRPAGRAEGMSLRTDGPRSSKGREDGPYFVQGDRVVHRPDGNPATARTVAAILGEQTAKLMASLLNYERAKWKLEQDHATKSLRAEVDRLRLRAPESERLAEFVGQIERYGPLEHGIARVLDVLADINDDFNHGRDLRPARRNMDAAIHALLVSFGSENDS